jgi:Flp pilus assembly protein TadG
MSLSKNESGAREEIYSNFFMRFKKLFRLTKRNSGQAIVEFAILLPIAALIVYATLEIARVYVVQRHLVTATSVGARTGTFRTSTVGDVQNAIGTYLSSTEVGTNYTANIVGVSLASTSNTMVTVSLITNLQLFTAFAIPGVTTLPLTSSVTMRHQ